MSADSVVVIGAGLAGLSAAIRLGNRGRSVTVLEAGAEAGGCCSTTDVDGFRFNNGAIYVTTPASLRRIFGRLDMDLDACLRLRAIATPQLSIVGNGTRVFTTSAEGSWVEGDDAARRTARYRDELERLRREWRPVYRRLVDDVLPYEFSTFRMLARLWRYLPRMTGTVADLFNRCFSDPEVRAAAGAITLYTGLAPRHTPVTQIIGLMALLEEGFFLPEGGMGGITAALARRAMRNGTEVRLNARVERIECVHGRLKGVWLAGGEFVPAAAVIATNSAVDTIINLLDPEAIPSRLRRRADRAALSHRAVSVQLGVRWADDQLAPAFAVNRVPLLDEQYRFHRPAGNDVRWFGYTEPTGVLPALAPAGSAVVEMFAPVPAGLPAERIGPDRAAEIAERYIEALQKGRPCRVLARRILAPGDFARERHLYKGALYGLSPGLKPADYFPRRVGSTGLYLAGQTTWPGYGVPPAMLSGLHAADAILNARRP